ncbi:protein ALP1-like isoform X2 [Photinus pyralis]|uniref:protein ALP1-like isoform X2 n=1 Tax=Photinus pyralis TaxID=7054 RepID=UPI001267174F|nr:protein ALP1-like isoform X2 [Photinus pyralis]
MMSMHYMFRVGKNTVSQIIAETCQVIWDTLKPIVFVEPCAENWKKIAREFEVKWNFKNCIGAIDGKHVVMQALPNSGSTYYNYKGSHSYNLLAIADANYQFVMVDIGGEGRQSDSDPDEVPYVLVADEAFPLTEYMMRPYPRRGQLDMRKKVFNYRLSRARRVVESSFGLLAGRWRIFRKPIIASSTTIKKIIQSTVCLHNFILMKNEADYNIRVTENTGDIVMGNLCEINSTGSNTYSRNASTIREKFADYFSGLGAVEWQWEKALQNDF